jgi:DNA-binding Lrp family transcriptional regulator
MDMKVKNRRPLLPERAILDERDQALITVIQTGLPISATPYADLGEKLGMHESEVIARIKQLSESKVIKRFGIVVRHHELGYQANAMTVWNIPDEIVTELGSCMGQFDFVTLCYRRPRRLPDWPYNLFTMIHGQNRDDVLANIQLLIERCELDEIQHDVLFSTRRFKQRGAIYRKPSTKSKVS